MSAPGHIEAVTTIFVEAMEAMFGTGATQPHPDAFMRDLSVHVEYPKDEENYPGFWVQYVPQGDVQNVGIGHYEEVAGSAPGTTRKAYRWKFKGVVEIVVAATSNLQRARMVDALIETIAVGVPDDAAAESVFRAYVADNDLVGLAVAWESFNVGGFAENPGTPWGTDEVIYEGTATLLLEGEFLFDPVSRDLVPLSSIVSFPEGPGDPDRDPAGVDGQWR